MKTVTHYGVCATDGNVPGMGFVPKGTILGVKKEVADDDALDWLNGDKRFMHKILDHRRNLQNCRHNICGKIQEEIDTLIATEGSKN